MTTQANGNKRQNFYPLSGINKNAPLTQKLSSVLSSGEQFYAAPLIYCGVLIAVGMNNNVFSADAKTGEAKMRRNLGAPYNIAAEDPTCRDITNNVGALATPVIDPNSNTVFITYRTYRSGTSSGKSNAM